MNTEPTKAPTTADLDRLILSEATEDRKGLWEICWALRTDFSLTGSDHELGRILYPVMQNLVQKGFITLETNQWGREEFSPVAAHKTDQLLTDPANWSSPPDKDYYAVWCVATDQGKRAFDLLREGDSASL